MLRDSCGAELCEGLQRSNIGVAIIDREMRYQQVNQALADMNGASPAEHIGASLGSILGDLAENVQRVCEGVFSNGHPVNCVMFSGKKLIRPLLQTWVGVADYIPLMNDKGKVSAVCVLILDASQETKFLGAAPSLRRTKTFQNEESDVVQGLTTRELQVLTLLAEGKSSKQTANTLQCSVKTIESYRARVSLKLGLNSLVDLVHFAIRQGIVEP